MGFFSVSISLDGFTGLYYENLAFAAEDEDEEDEGSTLVVIKVMEINHS